jgi:hypothetical protein
MSPLNILERASVIFEGEQQRDTGQTNPENSESRLLDIDENLGGSRHPGTRYTRPGHNTDGREIGRMPFQSEELSSYQEQLGATQSTDREGLISDLSGKISMLHAQYNGKEAPAEVAEILNKYPDGTYGYTAEILKNELGTLSTGDLKDLLSTTTAMVESTNPQVAQAINPVDGSSIEIDVLPVPGLPSTAASMAVAPPPPPQSTITQTPDALTGVEPIQVDESGQGRSNNWRTPEQHEEIIRLISSGVPREEAIEKVKNGNYEHKGDANNGVSDNVA